MTTEAYRRVAALAGLDAVFDALSATAQTDVSRLAELAGKARTAMLAAPVPDPVARAVAAGYARLGADAPVAVRSSATAEDLPFASFAGQQDTYLNIVGQAAVMDAVRRCWASLWTDRAVAYRATNGIDHRTVRLAVVIQRMVDASVAGVLFTANSVTGRRKEAVIDASPGLGEAVVSGAVNPDHFVVDTATGRILERRIGDKRLAIRSKSGGGTEHIAQATGATEACLADDQIRALAALGDRVETHYGSPQDTEWALDGSGVFWLDAGATHHDAVPTARVRAAARAGPSRLLLLQRCARTLSADHPDGTCGFPLDGFGRIGAPRLPRHGPLEGPEPVRRGRTASLCGRHWCPAEQVRPGGVPAGSGRHGSAFGGHPSTGRDRSPSLNRQPIVAAVPPQDLRIAARYRVPVTVVRALVSPDRARLSAEKVGASLVERLVVPESATAAERLDFAERTLSEDASAAPARHAGSRRRPGDARRRRHRCSARMRGADDLQTVLRGLPHNITTKMDLALWDLAGRIREDRDAAVLLRDGSTDDLTGRFRAGNLPAVAQRGLGEFLSRYGHRAVAEIDLGIPRWSDDPRHILGVLANYLRLEDGMTAPDAVFARSVKEAESMVETLTSRAARRSRVRARLVRFALSRARSLAGLRELPKYNLIVAIGAVRRQLANVGETLAAQGRLDRADDVFFVDLVEARAGLAGRDLRELVARRRESYDLELRRRHVPRVLLSDGTEPEAASPVRRRRMARWRERLLQPVA